MSQQTQYRIHPSIGIARLGNSPDGFYLAPETIGGVPIEADPETNLPLQKHGKPKAVKKFKDELGRIKRQAATFKIYRSVDGGPEEVLDLNDERIASVEWTVHVANKKAAWWNFVPLLGDLMLGGWNSYKTWQNPPADWMSSFGVPASSWAGSWMDWRNSTVTDKDPEARRQKRQGLIIDPGPRTLTGPGQAAEFDSNVSKAVYPHVSFPDPSTVTQGLSVQTLGEMRTDADGNLLVLGGFGRAGGSETITGFGGGDTWHDDIADGPVTARISFKDNTDPVTLQAWVVTGSPKFAPELVNISTWNDVMVDTAIKYLNAQPEVYDAQKWAATDGWNPDYEVSYQHDVQPFLCRIADYQWVGTVPSMTAFIQPAFDAHDASEENREQREKFVSYFRKPSKIRQASSTAPAALVDGQSNQLFSGKPGKPHSGIPLVPANAGTNSVRNNILDKFSTVTDTQYYCLQQWAAGKFSADAAGIKLAGVHALDAAALGNCVGEPMCPGIEVTWSVRNPIIYDAPYQIKRRHDEDYYRQHGLSPDEDECDPLEWNSDRTWDRSAVGRGCEPGDLTKRMAIPWQADFYDCSVQMINFNPPVDPNKYQDGVKYNGSGIPIAPTYYSYWWPPQSPWNVLSGGMTPEEQELDGVPAGMQVMYSRGINNFTQMIMAWKYLGFIVNNNKDAQYGRQYPYFSEKERNFDKFQAISMGAGAASSFITGDDNNYLPAWFLKQEDQPQTTTQTTTRTSTQTTTKTTTNALAQAPEPQSLNLSIAEQKALYHEETPKKIQGGIRRRAEH